MYHSPMIITISWKAWSGKWTASKMIAEQLWYERISIGDMKRKIAEHMWIDILEFNKLWEQPGKAAEFDLKYEEYQKNLDPNSNIIIDSRMWFYCQPKAFKVFLTVDDQTSAQRILWDNRATDNFSDLGNAIQEIKERNESDVTRYKKLYNINYLDPANFDFILDTTHLTPQETTQKIIEALNNFSMK